MSASLYQGARRALLSNPAGAGGIAGQSITAGDYIGPMGFNGSEHNPRSVRDDTGAVVQYPVGDGSFKPPTIVVVQSWRRNTDEYPLPTSFRLNLPQTLRSVVGIEVLELNVPNVAGAVPDHREFLLLNGILRGSTFTPQRTLGENNLAFQTMVANTSKDPSATVTDDANHLQLDDYALLRMPYDSSKALQYYSRDGWHRKSLFAHPMDKLTYLDFTLATVFGEAYAMNAAHEWSATIQIFCK